jgi:hypothetical protein
MNIRTTVVLSLTLAFVIGGGVAFADQPRSRFAQGRVVYPVGGLGWTAPRYTLRGSGYVGRAYVLQTYFLYYRTSPSSPWVSYGGYYRLADVNAAAIALRAQGFEVFYRTL